MECELVTELVDNGADVNGQNIVSHINMTWCVCLRYTCLIHTVGRLPTDEGCLGGKTEVVIELVNVEPT